MNKKNVEYEEIVGGRHYHVEKVPVDDPGKVRYFAFLDCKIIANMPTLSDAKRAIKQNIYLMPEASSSIKEKVDSYYDFLKLETHVSANDGSNWTIISTPFLGLFNDTLEVYAKNHEDRIILSDDGKTLHNLELLGVSFQHDNDRDKALNKILANYGVKVNEGNLVVETQDDDFPNSLHGLIQTMLQISYSFAPVQKGKENE